MNCKKRLLFVLKKRSGYGVSYGLAHSAKFICNALEKCGIECKIVEVIDNNCIDKEVHNFKPTHCVIEALWVVPEKFKVLLPLHPKVKWAVRIHSKIPFLSTEGIAMKWLYGYQKDIFEHYDNFVVQSNAYKTTYQLCDLGIATDYAPNIYDPGFELDSSLHEHNHHHHTINIGCFGSIRPLKNQLQQATAAIRFADNIGKKLRYHINSTRCEQKGEPVLHNIEALFASNKKHELVEHDWMPHREFCELVRTLDLGLQVSYSESFNIVAADFVWQNVPVVGSPDIEWLSPYYKADPNNYQDIVEKLENAYNYRNIGLQWLNKYRLYRHNVDATEKWLEWLLGDEVCQ